MAANKPQTAAPASGAAQITQRLDVQEERLNELKKTIESLVELTTKKFDELSDVNKNMALSLHNMELAVNTLNAKSAAQAKRPPKPATGEKTEKTADASTANATTTPTGATFPSNSRVWLSSVYYTDQDVVKKYLNAEQIKEAQTLLSTSETYAKHKTIDPSTGKTDISKATLLKQKQNLEVGAYLEVIKKYNKNDEVQSNWRAAKSEYENNSRTPAKKD